MNQRANQLSGAVIACAATVALALSACGSGAGSRDDNRGHGDVTTGKKDYTPPRIVNNADGYPNVSIKCDGEFGYLIFTATHHSGDAPPVVVPDPRCPGWRPGLQAPGQPATGSTPPSKDDGG